MNDPLDHPKYQIVIHELDKFSWKATVGDLHAKPPSATSITAKSLDELMSKVLMAVCLRERGAGVDEGALPTGYETLPLPADSNGQKPIILSPAKRRIITGN